MSESLLPIPLEAPGASAMVKRIAKGGGGFLPRIQFVYNRSKIIEEGEVEFPINTFALVRQKKYHQLGANPEAILIAYRVMFLDTSGDDPIAIYNPEEDDRGLPVHPEAMRIMETADDKSLKDSGCQYGLQFLVWLPEVKEFGTLFMGTESARNETEVLLARIGEGSKLKGHKISNSKYTWYIATVIPCSTITESPTAEELTAVLEKFNNPKDSEVETVPVDQAEDDKPKRKR